MGGTRLVPESQVKTLGSWLPSLICFGYSLFFVSTHSTPPSKTPPLPSPYPGQLPLFKTTASAPHCCLTPFLMPLQPILQLADRSGLLKYKSDHISLCPKSFNSFQQISGKVQAPFPSSTQLSWPSLLLSSSPLMSLPITSTEPFLCQVLILKVLHPLFLVTSTIPLRGSHGYCPFYR